MEPREPKAFFDDRGYLIVEDLLSADEIEQSQREIQRLHQLAADLEAREDDPRLKHFQREPFATDENRYSGCFTLPQRSTQPCCESGPCNAVCSRRWSSDSAQRTR